MNLSSQDKDSFSNWHFLILTLQLALPILSTDIYLPSLDTIALHFETSASYVQLTLALYFLALSFSQLIYGPLSDRFGRKPMLIISLLIYFIASIVCLMANSIELLILGRFLQGLGAGSAILTFAIIRDRYEGKHAAKVIAYMSSVVALSPIIAPIIGSYIQIYLSWQWNFILLAIMSLCLLIAGNFFLPETNIAQRKEFSLFKQTLTDYYELLQNRHFMKNALSASFAFGALLTYVCGAPYVLFNFIGDSPQSFGWIFAIPASGYVLGAYLNGHLISRFGMEKMSHFGMINLVSGALITIIACYIFPQSITAFIAPQIICEFGISIIISTRIAMALQSIPLYAGTGSSLIGFLRFIVAALASKAVLMPQTTTPLMLGSLIFGASLLSLGSMSMQSFSKKERVA